MRSSRVVLLAALAGVAIRFASIYPELPTTMASHFGAGGKPNGWMPRSGFAALSAAVSVLMLLVFLGGPLLLKRVPHPLINLPNKLYWLAAERKEATFAYLASTIEWLGATTFVFIGLVNELVFAANTKPSSELAETPLVVGLVLILSVNVGSGIAMYLRFARVPKNAAGAAGVTHGN
ncbi:MAG: DUF1648 domain-containing protein [Deltaproteobacteria bacterium]|nr:DUF1648 domain-containing protein [Deltaproteobacteria bacterium]